jgi:thioredoxin 1
MKRIPTQASLHPTVETFDEEVLQSDVPVLVDFWAPWCPPCMMLKPEVERLVADLGGRAKVALINVDEEPELAGMFEVSSIPALMIVKKGRRVDAWTGYAPRSAILARIEKHLDKPKR